MKYRSIFLCVHAYIYTDKATEREYLQKIPKDTVNVQMCHVSYCVKQHDFVPQSFEQICFNSIFFFPIFDRGKTGYFKLLITQLMQNATEEMKEVKK